MRDRVETRWEDKTKEEKKKEVHDLIISLTEDQQKTPRKSLTVE